MKAVSMSIFGRVQGVGFRYYTEREARRLGISGFVQNRPDGSVYIEAEGEDAAMEAFIAWCHQGPRWAVVRKITVSELPPLGRIGFVVR
ncbi:MAG TPA: acylphosphatase [Bacteroidales bacterium]|nr:acylphosphatase [Bacteroidales bacterium]